MVDSKRHKHADVIITWANGAEIELKNACGEWEPEIYTPTWENWKEYRIKPEPDIRNTRSIIMNKEKTRFALNI